MRDALNTYGFFASFGVFAVAAWMTVSALSGGGVPGAHGAAGSVTATLALASAVLGARCLHLLVVKDTDA